MSLDTAEPVVVESDKTKLITKVKKGRSMKMTKDLSRRKKKVRNRK